MSAVREPRSDPAPRRRRRWPWVLLALVSILLLALFAGWIWLFHTAGGRDFALTRATALLPPGDRIAIARREGSLSDLVLEDVEAEIAGTLIVAGRVELALTPVALLRRTVDIDALAVSGVRVTLPPGEPADNEATGDGSAWPDLRLPVAIDVESLSLRDAVVLQDGDPVLGVAQLDLAASLARDGTLVLRDLGVVSDRARIAGGGTLRMDGALAGRAQLAIAGPAADAPAARVALSRDDGVQRLTLTLPDATSPAVELAMEDGRWRLRSDLEGFDPSPWYPDWTGDAITADIDAEGVGRSAQLSGRVGIGANVLTIEPSRLALSDDAGTLTLDPLVVVAPEGGTATLEGSVALAADADMDVRAALDGVMLPGEPPASVDGELAVTGTLDDYTARFEGELQRDALHVDLRFDGEGSTERIALAPIVVRADGVGGAEGEISVQWTPSIAAEFALDLDDLDPGWFDPRFEGDLSGHITGTAGADDDDWHADITVASLDGTLRGRRVEGSGRIALVPDGGQTDFSLRIGDSRLSLVGDGGDPLDLTATLRPLQLADVLPDAGGRVIGTVRATGARAAPDIAFDIDAGDLTLGDHRVGSLVADGAFPLSMDGPLHADVLARDLRVADRDIAEATLAIDGPPGDHTFSADLRSDAGDLSLRATGALADGRWRGMLQALSLALPERTPWTLDAPAALAVGPQSATLEHACLRGGEFRLCAEITADGAAQRGSVTLDDVPLATLLPLLGERAVPVVVDGDIGARATFERTGDALTAEATLRLPGGSVALEGAEQRELLDWRDITLDAALDPQSLRVTGDGTLEDTGRLHVRIDAASPLASPDGALDGEIALSLPRLRVLELLSPDVAGPDGRLDADLSLAGRWSAPEVRGSVDVTALRGEIPALGIALRDSRLSVEPRGADAFAITGEFTTAQGTLSLDGEANAGEDGWEAQFGVRGSDVLVADTPFVRAVVSPDIDGRFAQRRLTLTGSVGVPEARLDLEQLESSVQPSPDVTVTDPREGEAGGDAFAVVADIQVVLGEDVELVGFGFDGAVAGTVSVRERPGRVTTARGSLNVTGDYEAYGQELEIVRGRLLFSGTPVDNPALDIRAERHFDEQMVGLEVRGTALRPILNLYSDPPLDQAEALSYLVLGRPLRSASEADGAELGQAAAAIGGNLLAGRVGARLGFDTFEVADSRALGGAAFTVGKYLSPRLYASYGVSLFGEGQVLTFKYILSRRWEAEIEAGTENRAGLNYTLER